jgi:hypothetical protein
MDFTSLIYGETFAVRARWKFSDMSSLQKDLSRQFSRVIAFHCFPFVTARLVLLKSIMVSTIPVEPTILDVSSFSVTIWRVNGEYVFMRSRVLRAGTVIVGRGGL